MYIQHLRVRLAGAHLCGTSKEYYSISSFNLEECLFCPVGAAFAGMRLPQRTACQTRQHSSKQDLNAVNHSPFECLGVAFLSVS